MENEILVKKNIRLAHYMTQRYVKWGSSEYDDMFGTACLGLVIASQKYDKTKYAKFSTFACVMMNNELLRYLRSKNLKRVVPDNLVTSISQNCEQSEPYYDMEEEVINKLELENFIRYLDSQSNTDKTIFSLIYGLNGETHKQKEVAKMMGVSHTAIQLRMKKVLNRYRKIYNIGS